MSKMHITDIIAKTIRMQPPINEADINRIRKAKISDETNEKLISHEAYLRKSAYKNTTINPGEAFFDDSDMTTEYFLVVVYNHILDIPLLSVRYYFDRTLISKSLNGNSNEELNLINFKDGELFLADRFSGNIYNSIYRHNRSYILSLIYSQILILHKNCSLILMARKEKRDKLLKKYLNLGFHIVGSTLHNGKEHWIVLIDLKKV